MADTTNTSTFTDYYQAYLQEHQAYLKEVEFSKKCMQNVHNLTNENQNLKAQRDSLNEDLQRLSSSSESIHNIIDAFMKALADNNMAITIKHDECY